MTDKYGVGQDPYCYKNTSVLINLLDLKSDLELEAAEVELTSYRLKTFQPDFENLTFAYLCQIHYHLFQDLYEWAGQVRTVDISKQDTHFCNVRFIVPSATKCFDLLKKNNFFRALRHEEFVKVLADFFCEMNVVHPFREGNGRTLRLFCEVLAMQAGYELNWQPISQEAWLQANIAGYQGDLEPLVRLFKISARSIN
ncbi:putative adenosine monophosphate-protein transferase Fic [Rheinheimera sp.]|uniref:putative adenosine monophosphate-protein transferase Fic n=1 Tax=Rheinheimera sp. TaxID=1869214 RepID=UPI002B487E5F|nr:putative adenosine monophosphate-protein transferase Fic [Rheinheimera sp.]HJS16451.1 putative adenosine monophosphate-protein transferase Fic [Rheinheimera sp.]